MEAGISQQLSKRLLTIGGVGSILKPVLAGLAVKYFYSQNWGRNLFSWCLPDPWDSKCLGCTSLIVVCAWAVHALLTFLSSVLALHSIRPVVPEKTIGWCLKSSGFSDIEDLFQPKQFCDSENNSGGKRAWEKGKALVVFSCNFSYYVLFPSKTKSDFPWSQAWLVLFTTQMSNLQRKTTKYWIKLWKEQLFCFWDAALVSKHNAGKRCHL